MNIHEYQAKSLLKKYHVRVPEGRLVDEGGDTGKKALAAAQELSRERGNKVWVVKAQIHAGGRGKAGGVKLCKTIEEVAPAAKEIMGTKAYDIAHVKKIVSYASKKVKTTIAPVWVDGINDAEMEKIIAFGKEIHCLVRIQKFCLNKFGRNPVEELSWEEFFAKIDALEKKTGVKLKEDVSAYTLENTKEYPIPFSRKEVVEAQIIGPGRYPHERLCVARERLISVSPCRKESGKIKIRILKTTHNVIVAEEV